MCLNVTFIAFQISRKKTASNNRFVCFCVSKRLSYIFSIVTCVDLK